MVDMREGPGVVTMATDGFRLRTHVVFKRVGRARALAGHDLFVLRLVVQGFRVKGSFADGSQVLFFRTLQVLSVGSPLGFLGDRIVVGFQNLIDELDNRSSDFALAATMSVLRKQSQKPAAVACFGLMVALPPALFRAGWHGSLRVCLLPLLVIIVVFRMNDPIAEDRSRQISLAGPLQQFFPRRRQERLP